MYKALELPKDLVPVCDSLEKLCLIEAKAVQIFTSLLTAVMPCPIVHLFYRYLVCMA
jgi:hypothetical protein